LVNRARGILLARGGLNKYKDFGWLGLGCGRVSKLQLNKNKMTKAARGIANTKKNPSKAKIKYPAYKETTAEKQYWLNKEKEDILSIIDDFQEEDPSVAAIIREEYTKLQVLHGAPNRDIDMFGLFLDMLVEKGYATVR
jgi:hypothetical protein